MVHPYRWTITRRGHPDRSQQAATLRVDDNPGGGAGGRKPRGEWDGYPEVGEEKRTIKQPDKAKKQISYEN